MLFLPGRHARTQPGTHARDDLDVSVKAAKCSSTTPIVRSLASLWRLIRRPPRRSCKTGPASFFPYTGARLLAIILVYNSVVYCWQLIGLSWVGSSVLRASTAPRCCGPASKLNKSVCLVAWTRPCGCFTRCLQSSLIFSEWLVLDCCDVVFFFFSLQITNRSTSRYSRATVAHRGCPA